MGKEGTRREVSGKGREKIRGRDAEHLPPLALIFFLHNEL